LAEFISIPVLKPVSLAVLAVELFHWVVFLDTHTYTSCW